MKHFLLLAAFATLAFFPTGCSTGADGKPHLDSAKIGAWWESDRTQAVVSVIEQTAIKIGLNALSAKLDSDHLSGLAYGVRTLEGLTSSPAQISSQAISFNAPVDVATQIANAITSAKKQGIPESVAKEAVARGLEQSAAIAAAP